MVIGLSEYMIKVRNLWKSYPVDGRKIIVLDGIDLDIRKGEMVALVGPSGSGKTTLLNILSGLDSADDGEVIVNGMNILKLGETKLAKYRRNHVGFIFQTWNLVNFLTVVENVELPLLLNGWKRKKARKKAIEILEKLGISGLANKYPRTLSGGEQQRAAIARALIHEPEVIYCDEPTGNLDHENTIKFVKVLKDIQKETRQTVIIVTHDMDLARACDREIDLIELKERARKKLMAGQTTMTG